MDVVETIHNGYVNEPIGIYSSEEKADFYSKKVTENFESKAECNILPIFLDEPPPILEFVKESKQDAVNEVLYSLYEAGAFEQMVEPDGSFSYSLKKGFQSSLEKIISRRI
jgi:hypothetical protein